MLLSGSKRIKNGLANMKAVRQSIGGLGNLLFKQAYLLSQWADGDIPDIYVQDEKYFARHKDLIRKSFSDGIGYTDMVSLHIRRGDYLKSGNFYIDLGTTDYYKKAVTYFPDARFLVFCKDNQGMTEDNEDRYWCEQFLNQIIPGRFEFAPVTNSETDDLNLMASCQSNIMANSSFSWWAAWLNPNKDKKVICPAQWFSDGIQRCVLLNEWIKI